MYILNRRLLLKRACILCIAGMVLTWACGESPRQNSSPEPPEQISRKDIQPVPENLPEVTIRNVTDKPITYKIRPRSSEDETKEKTIQMGEVHRFPTDEEMYISFSKGSIRVRYKLDPGLPFSFRYDEKDQLELYDGSHGREDAVDLAPYVPTPLGVVESMLQMAEVDENDVVYDIGCGDGRIVVMAARRFGARGVGIDLDPKKLQEARRNAREAGVEALVEFRQEDAVISDYSEATVVTMYLLPESNKLLRPILERQLKEGARVVSHNYDIPGWEDREAGYESIEAWDGESHSIYLYIK